MVTVGVAVGFCKVELNPSVALQFHAVALLELALKVAVPPTQIAPLFVAPLEVGTGLTVTVVKYIVPGLQPLPVLLTVNA